MESGVRIRESELWILRSGVWCLLSGSGDSGNCPESETRILDSRKSRFPSLWILESGDSEILCLESGVLSLESGFWNPEFGVWFPES